MNIPRRVCVGVAAGCGVLIGLSAAAVGAAPAPSSLQASSVLADVKAHGAQEVAASLGADNERWNEVMTNIGRGEPAWLRVAVALHPGTDAGASEELNEAVFFALKPAPAAVLQLLQEHQFDTEFVCSSNIGTDYTAEKSRRFIQDRIKTLRRLSDPKIRAVRDQCLTGLRAALKDFSDPEKKRAE